MAWERRRRYRKATSVLRVRSCFFLRAKGFPSRAREDPRPSADAQFVRWAKLSEQHARDGRTERKFTSGALPRRRCAGGKLWPATGSDRVAPKSDRVGTADAGRRAVRQRARINHGPGRVGIYSGVVAERAFEGDFVYWSNDGIPFTRNGAVPFGHSDVAGERFALSSRGRTSGASNKETYKFIA